MMKGKGQDTPVTEAVEYMCSLTPRERACIDYLVKAGDLGAGPEAIGEYISSKVPNCRPNAYALGASTCGRLRAVGLVVHLGDEPLYRLSAGAQMMLGKFRVKSANGQSAGKNTDA